MSRDAFIARKQNGLSLSDRVWRYREGFKTEMEMGLDLGIRAGKSADQISRDLRQYLQHPDMLFRRVRDEHGILHLSKRAKAFHPGQGVYRSSYLNARRLAVTETNTAYRTADHERWQDMDFVVGIEIHLSGNHTCKGRDGKPHRFTDICDELAGRYPKDFKFTGWHPHCRCYATSILKTEEEMAADNERILNGEPVSEESKNAVKDVPDNFKEWLKENEERMERAKVMPMFLRDNRKFMSNQFGSEEPLSKTRHLGALGRGKQKKEKKDIAKENEVKIDVKLNPSSEVVEYTRQQAEQIGAKMEKPMNFNKADKGNANVKKDKDNCQSSVVAFFARLLGMKVTAKEYRNGGAFVKLLEEDQTLAYYKSPTEKVHPEKPRKLMSEQEVYDFIEKETAKNGIYNVAFNKWKNLKDGHIMCLIKKDGKAYLIDIQSGKRKDLEKQIRKVDFIIDEKDPENLEKCKGVEILRVDKLVLSDEALSILVPLN